MRKRMIAFICTLAMLTASLCGCGKNQETPNAEKAETTQQETEEQKSENSGTIKLRVWAEKPNFPMMEQMIKSFQKQYASEADFEITLEENADSETKNVMLGEIHKSPDVFIFPDDQLSGLAAAGALYLVPNAEEEKKQMSKNPWRRQRSMTLCMRIR
ncbi:MAG: hypothetical protein ACI4HI_16790 [Lachnospiraceae bacterium]